jgi:multifunctional 2-oxoglutarate metabolism enzyme
LKILREPQFHLTNPGTIGTVHSVPRLVQGQGMILGVGALDYPAEFHGANEETLAELRY